MISYTLFVDSWSQTFISLILGIGLLVALFAFAYLHKAADRWRFFPAFTLFAVSMLGVVTLDHLLMLFVCWELTSILSFFLIAFDPENPKARRGALHAMLVTGAGGLCLLLAVLMIHQVFGTYSLAEILPRYKELVEHPWATTIAVLVLAAGMTKSAFFPFSFWLPGAMTAPTPVSSYLHSATMVKAGIFLFYRMNPLFSELDIWGQLLITVGAWTFLSSAIRSFSEDDLKGILAYTTVSSLGLMGMMIGWGTEASLQAVPVFLVAHALYKCGLFQLAGIIDHQVHTRKLSELGGLKNQLPFLWRLSLLLAFVGLGFIPSYAFLAKEKLLLSLEGAFWPLVILFIGFSFMGAAVLRVCLGPFLGRAKKNVVVDEPGLFLCLSPLALGFLSLSLVFFTGKTQDLWHGLNLELVLSLCSILLSVTLYKFAVKTLRSFRISEIDGAGYFDRLLKWHFKMALKITRYLQSGSLRQYILFILIACFAMVLWQWPSDLKMRWEVVNSSFTFLIFALAIVKGFALYWLIRSDKPLTAVLSLGLVGYVMAILFALYGAPDLAMTQFSVETLSVFLFVFILKDIPRMQERSSQKSYAMDVMISIFSGVMVFALVWFATLTRAPSRLREYFAENSLSEAYGSNVVNVILVDFRGFDTLGEITVLAVAAIGVLALLNIQKGKA